MKIKNISSSPIKIPELEINLNPGDTGDLTVDPAKIRTHPLIKALFEKGLLVNLGHTSPPGSQGSLLAAKERMKQLKLTGSSSDYVIKPAKRTQSNKSRIEQVLGDIDTSRRQSPSAPTYDPEIERYNKQYYANMYPEQIDSVRSPLPRTKIDNQFRPIEVNWHGEIDFSSRGKIPTETLTGEPHPLKNPSLVSKDKSKITITDRAGQEHSVSFDNIKERMMRRCIGTSNSGRPCKKFAVMHFQSCLTHMSQQERQEYETLKKNS